MSDVRLLIHKPIITEKSSRNISSLLVVRRLRHHTHTANRTVRAAAIART